VAGWVGVSFDPDRYAASARVHVDSENLLQPLLRGIAVDVDSRARLDVLQRTLVSGPNLERVARKAGLAPESSGAAGPLPIPSSVIAALQHHIEMKAERDGLFSISYEDSNPRRAYRVVQSLVDVFMESRLGPSQVELDSTRNFLSRQVHLYEERMHAAERALTAFKQENMGLLPGGSSFLDVYGRAQIEAPQIEAELQDLRAQEQELGRQLAAQPAFIESDGQSVVMGGPPSSLEVRILDLEQRLDDLRVRYTDKHPEVVKTQAMLDQLRVEMDAQAANVVDTGKARQKLPNDVRRAIQMQLLDVQSRIAAAQSRLARKTQEIKDLRSRMSQVPEIEGKLTRLEREVQMARRNYEELVGRQDSAILSENRETQSDLLHFSVIDPPRLPTTPSGLKRALLMSGILVGGLALGFIASVGIVLVRDTFLSSRQLARVIGIPVLGAVSFEEAAPHLNQPDHRRRTAIHGGALMALLCLYAVLMLVEHNIGLARLRLDIVGGAAAVSAAHSPSPSPSPPPSPIQR
jgi:polysaccharide chain length determinant protein (PEP-CTERM system associated)